MDNKKRESRPSARERGGPATSGALPTPSSSTNHSTESEDDPKAIPVRRADGRKVGELVGDVLRKEARASRHMLRKPRRAWGCDVSVLEWAEDHGASWVEVEDLETGEIYRAPLVDFWAHGFPVRRGHGKQLALPLNRWIVRKPDESPSPQLVQLALPFADR